MRTPLGWCIGSPLFLGICRMFIIAAAALDLDPTLGVQMIIFVTFIFVMKALLFDPYLKAMDARREAIEGAREEAGDLDSQAESVVREYEEKMTEARLEARNIRESLRDSALNDQREISEEARAEITRKLAQEREKLQAAVDAARGEIQLKSEEISRAMVQRMLTGNS